MPVPNETPITYATGNGSSAGFAFPWSYGDASHVKATVDGVVQPYTVVGNVVAFTVAPAAAASIVIYRETPRARTTDYQNSGDLLADTLDADIDNLQRQLQEVGSGAAGVTSAVRAPAGETIPELPDAAARANRIAAFDADGNPIVIAGVDAGSAAALALDLLSTDPAKGDALMWVQRLLPNAVGRTFHEWIARQPINMVSDLGVVADGTDQTAAILTRATALGAGLSVLPYGVKYTSKTLLQSLPTNHVFLDLTGINDFNAPGETSKVFGIVSSDNSPSDTHWSVTSGHHAIMTLNNFGTAVSSSSDERKASLLWAVGKFQNGAENKLGFRGAAILQWTQETSSPYWKYTMRSLAPWTAIDAEYEGWIAGEVIGGANVYRVTGVGHYVSAGGGTCGSTEPVHTTGTVSDGGVLWTFVDSSDRTVFQIDEHNRIMLGPGDGSETFSHKVARMDPTGGSYLFHARATGVSKIAQLRLTPTNASSVEVLTPFLRASADNGLEILKSDGSAALARISDTQATFRSIGTTSFEVTSGTTPSVAGLSCIRLNYGAPATITDFTGATDDQILTVICQTNNITFAHSVGLTLQGSANLTTPAAWSVITFRRIPASVSSRWIEVSRSIK